MELSRNYQIEVLTPTCIAHNRKYQYPEFVIENNKIKILNIEKIIENKPEVMEILFPLNHQRNKGTYPKDFIQKLQKESDSNLFKYVIDFYNYNQESGQPFPEEIYAFIKTGGKIYIPGSSIKGAFVLNFLKNKSNAEHYLKKAQSFLASLKKEIYDNKKLENKLIEQNQRTEKLILGDTNKSIFRFLSFSDTNPVDSEKILKVSIVKVFSINQVQNQLTLEWFAGVSESKVDRKIKRAVYNKDYTKAKTILVETIISQTILHGKYKFFIPKQIIKHLESPLINKYTDLHSILEEIRNNVLRRINLEIEFLNQIKPKISGDTSILKAYLDHFNHLKNLAHSLKDNQIIIQMGIFTGFISKTLIDHDIPLPTEIKKLKYPRSYSIFPKTRRVMINSSKVKEPGWVETPGWVKITFD